MRKIILLISLVFISTFMLGTPDPYYIYKENSIYTVSEVSYSGYTRHDYSYELYLLEYNKEGKIKSKRVY